MPTSPPLPSLVLIALVSGCAPIGPADPDPCTTCVVSDNNNFSLSSVLDVGTAALRAEADARLEWSTLTRDIRGGALDARTDIDEARLIVFRNLEPAEIAEGLAHDSLNQADVTLYVTCTPTDASCMLSDFGIFGNHFDIQQYFIEGDDTWLLALGRHGEASADALLFLEAHDASAAGSASVTDTTSTLNVDVDFVALTPVVVPAADRDLQLDWSGLTRTGLGDPIAFGSIDTLRVARFSESPADLESDVFGLEARAEESWTLPVEGWTTAALADLAGDSPFGGIDATSTWMLSLECGLCANPAPRFVTLLTTDGAE